MTSRLVMAALSALLLTGIAGCSDFRKAIGKEKSTPDEFQVVVRPPLSLPPGFADRPETIVERQITGAQTAHRRKRPVIGW